MSESRTRLLFVCLGNICRSPLAEGVFLHQAAAAGLADRFVVDSAGTGGWHAGSLADPRSRAVAARRGIVLATRARQVVAEEHDAWDLVLAMDARNRDDLVALGFARDRVRLMRSFETPGCAADVPDPYYGGDKGFETVFEMLERACGGLLEHLRAAAGE
ncbi:MAG: low molecular weight protein-tyrosine-phosphatase [Phycisphaerales bacterium]